MGIAIGEGFPLITTFFEHLADTPTVTQLTWVQLT